MVLPCADERLRNTKIGQKLSRQIGAVLGKPFDTTKRWYVNREAGGNNPVGCERLLAALIHKATTNQSVIQLTDVVFTEHDDCAARAAGNAISQIRGIKGFVLLYASIQARFPAILEYRPRLWISHLAIDKPTVPFLEKVDDSVWGLGETRLLRSKQDWANFVANFFPAPMWLQE